MLIHTMHSPSTPTHTAQTALMEACLEDTEYYQQSRVLLLEAGSSESAVDAFGMTAWEILATVRGCGEVERVEY